MKIAVLTHRPLYPVVTGYSRAIIDTYISVAGIGHDVLIVAITPRVRARKVHVNSLLYLELFETRNVFLKLMPMRILLRLCGDELLFYHLLLLSKAYSEDNVVANVAKYIEEYLGEPDVIVSESLYPSLLSMNLSRVFSVPLVVRMHNIESLYVKSLTHIFKKKAYELISAFEKRIVKNVNRVITLSYEDKRLLEAMYGVNAIHLPPILLLGDSVPFDRLAELYGLEENRYFAYIASPHKPNILFLKYLLTCWSNIKRYLAKYGYKLVIGGSISPYALKLIQRYGLAKDNTIVVTGLLSRGEVRSLLEKAYACIAPHHGHGIPIKLVEALKLGVPTITTTNALNSLTGLKNKYNVYAVEDIHKLCKAILTLVSNKQLYENIRSNAIIISEKLNAINLAKHYVEVLFNKFTR